MVRCRPPSYHLLPLVICVALSGGEPPAISYAATERLRLRALPSSHVLASWRWRQSLELPPGGAAGVASLLSPAALAALRDGGLVAFSLRAAAGAWDVDALGLPPAVRGDGDGGDGGDDGDDGDVFPAPGLSLSLDFGAAIARGGGGGRAAAADPTDALAQRLSALGYAEALPPGGPPPAAACRSLPALLAHAEAQLPRLSRALPEAFFGAVNVGGFGQTETEVVLQDPARIYGYVAFCVSVIITQSMLVFKKKQYEKVQLAELDF
jgi:hypothetical protein